LLITTLFVDIKHLTKAKQHPPDNYIIQYYDMLPYT